MSSGPLDPSPGENVLVVLDQSLQLLEVCRGYVAQAMEAGATQEQAWAMGTELHTLLVAQQMRLMIPVEQPTEVTP